MRKSKHKIAVLILVVLRFVGGLSALGQESLLHITSPVTGDVVMEGQPLRITVAADASVRVLGVLAGYPLPDARLVGPNQFEMLIPKTVPPGGYELTAVGLASTDVESSPVSIQVERADSATELFVQPPLLSFAELGDKFPLRVSARFADGSILDVTHSRKVTFTPKNPEIVTVDDWGRAMAVSPGQSSVLVSYGATSTNPGSQAVYAALLVYCPRPKPTGPPPEIESATPETGVPGVTTITIRGRLFGNRLGSYVCIGTQNGVVTKWTDNEIVATVPKGAHQGTIYVMRGGLDSNVLKFVPIGLFIDGASGRLVAGGRVHLMGSGFGSEEEHGYVAVGDTKAEVVSWNSTEIILIVPESVIPGRVYKVSVHQSGQSREFPMISLRE